MARGSVKELAKSARMWYDFCIRFAELERNLGCEAPSIGVFGRRMTPKLRA